jgi:hypothetical protein
VEVRQIERRTFGRYEQQAATGSPRIFRKLPQQIHGQWHPSTRALCLERQLNPILELTGQENHTFIEINIRGVCGVCGGLRGSAGLRRSTKSVRVCSGN